MTLRYLSLLIILIAFDILFLYKNPSALSYILAGLGLIIILIVILVLWILKYNLLPITLVSLAGLTLMILACYLLYGRPKTLAKVEFEGASFGLEYIPDPSLEGYNRTDHIFFIPQQSKTRKYIYEHDDGFDFSSFPVDPGILSDKVFSIIDTVTRNIERYDPTVSGTTLYMDPKHFTDKEWNTFLGFVKLSYQSPDNKNPVLMWLNYDGDGSNWLTHDVEGSMSDHPHFIHTIYAIVYASLDDLEPVYVSRDGKKSLKIRVDHHIDFNDAPGQTQRRTVGQLKERILYCDPDENSKYFGEYRQGEKEFKSLYDSLKVW